MFLVNLYIRYESSEVRLNTSTVVFYSLLNRSYVTITTLGTHSKPRNLSTYDTHLTITSIKSKEIESRTFSLKFSVKEFLSIFLSRQGTVSQNLGRTLTLQKVVLSMLSTYRTQSLMWPVNPSLGLTTETSRLCNLFNTLETERWRGGEEI